MARKRDPIQKVELASGKVRWRFTIDVGRTPDGKRQQKRYTYDTLREAKAERARILADRAKGTYIRPTALTVAEYLATWLAGKRNLRPGTRRAYSDCLKPVAERLGSVELQRLTKADLDRLVDWMLTSGRRVGNVKRKGLSARTVNLTLGYLTQALDSAERQGLLARNVARLVERPTHRAKPTATWTAEQAAAFLAHVAEDRLHAAFLLTMYGLRRGEVLGLRWEHIDLDAATVTIAATRVCVAGQVIDEAPKSARSNRTLPMDTALVAALRKLRATQAAERLAAGAAYQRHGLVVVNELGQPYRPEWYGDTFARLARSAGLPAIRLHDARHTTGTLMHLRGVPVAVISAWLGHASAAFTMKTYVHSQDAALADAGKQLRAALGG